MATETHYRRHIIRSMKVGDLWNARAFRKNKIVGETRSGSNQEMAILAVKADLDASHERQLAKRVNGFPTVEEVRHAFAAIDITDGQNAMLMAHLHAPNRILTATELADAAGYESYSSTNIQYGVLGRKLAEEMGWQPEVVEGVQIWTYALATDADEGVRNAERQGSPHWRWKLRDEVAEAIAPTSGH